MRHCEATNAQKEVQEGQILFFLLLFFVRDTPVLVLPGLML